jgi:hypothetical protein
MGTRPGFAKVGKAVGSTAGKRHGAWEKAEP